jgi:hypothetical protein
MVMPDLWKEILPSITISREKVKFDDEYKSYVSFAINRALSKYVDCVLIANEMNKGHFLDKRLQYDFLFHIVRKGNRQFVPKIEKQENKNLDLIMKHYNYSLSKAQQVVNLIPKSELDRIEKLYDTGGK